MQLLDCSFAKFFNGLDSSLVSIISPAELLLCVSFLCNSSTKIHSFIVQYLNCVSSQLIVLTTLRNKLHVIHSEMNKPMPVIYTVMRTYIWASSIANSRACLAMYVFWIQSSGMELRPYFAPRHAPMNETLEQLHPPPSIAALTTDT